jgi:hypothetical protein
MAQTINFDEDFLPAEEMKSIQTKQAILAKLRVRFGEMPSGNGWTPMQKPDAATLARDGVAPRGLG